MLQFLNEKLQYSQVFASFIHLDHCASTPAAVWPVTLVTGSAADRDKWPNIISVDLGVRFVCLFVGLFAYPPKPVAIGATWFALRSLELGVGQWAPFARVTTTELVQLISLRFSTAFLPRFTVIADYATFCWTSPIEEIAKWVNRKDQCRTPPASLGKISHELSFSIDHQILLEFSVIQDNFETAINLRLFWSSTAFILVCSLWNIWVSKYFQESRVLTLEL